jgi:hypothetical protein
MVSCAPIHRAGAAPFDTETVGVLQYASAPFFAFPHKPIINWFLGAPYARAYYHFHRVHRSRTNLWLHLLCLPLQIGANFALAAEIDRIAGVDHYSLSLITAVVWAVHLLLTPSPYLIRLLTVGSICAAYASRHAVVAAWLPLMWAAGALHVLVLKYHRFYPWAHGVPVALLALARFGAQVARRRTHPHCCTTFTSSQSLVRAVCSPRRRRLRRVRIRHAARGAERGAPARPAAAQPPAVHQAVADASQTCNIAPLS